MLETAAPSSKAISEVRAEDILVVIPTWNEEAHIEACIRSLIVGDPRLEHVTMIVADGGSTDKTRNIVARLCGEFPNLGLMDNPERLQSAALNRAASTRATSNTRYLVRCDAHAIYPPSYVTRIADTLANTGAQSVVVCMDAVGETCFQRANAWIVDTPLGSGGSAHRGGTASGYYDHGHHAGFELKTFNALGGYDPTFSHNEDAEYDYRLGKTGGKIWLEASIRIDYLPRATVRSLARQYYNYGKGRARNLLKHKSKPKLRQLAPVVILLGSVGAVLLSPLLPIVLVAPAAYLALLAIASLWIAVRKRSICGLLSGLAASTMHMAWAAGFLKQVIRHK